MHICGYINPLHGRRGPSGGVWDPCQDPGQTPWPAPFLFRCGACVQGLTEKFRTTPTTLPNQFLYRLLNRHHRARWTATCRVRTHSSQKDAFMAERDGSQSYCRNPCQTRIPLCRLVRRDWAAKLLIQPDEHTATKCLCAAVRSTQERIRHLTGCRSIVNIEGTCCTGLVWANVQTRSTGSSRLTG